jgi:hypothetical protein
MPVAGLVRLRKHLFGRQSDHGTKVAATRAYPFRGVPEVELNWTDPEVDEGSLDPVAAPSRGAPDIGAPLTDNSVHYNDLPLKLAAFFGGNVSPTGVGTAQTWLFEPASETVDELDLFTYEMGDDVLDDWFQLGDGILTDWELTGPEGLGPLTDSMTWKFGSASSTGSTDSPVTGIVPTPALSVATNDAILYLKDVGIYIASDYANIATSQITDALHSFVLRFSREVDEKRWANADQEFDVDAFATASRAIELECSWAKTDDIVGLGSEADAWFSDDSVTRYVRIEGSSKVLAESPSTYYKVTIDMPMRYYTRSDGESGGNAIVVLTGHAFNEPDTFGGVLKATVVCTLTDAELGTIGS